MPDTWWAKWLAQFALVAYLTQTLIARTDLPTYAMLVAHDSHSLKKHDDSILAADIVSHRNRTRNNLINTYQRTTSPSCTPTTKRNKSKVKQRTKSLISPKTKINMTHQACYCVKKPACFWWVWPSVCKATTTAISAHTIIGTNTTSAIAKTKTTTSTTPGHLIRMNLTTSLVCGFFFDQPSRVFHPTTPSPHRLVTKVYCAVHSAR